MHEGLRLPSVARLVLLALLSGSTPQAQQADTRLVEAVKSRDHSAIRTLIEQRANVNAPEADGAAPLHWAAHWDDVETATLLVRAGGHVDSTNDLGVTPLMLACTNGSAALVSMLLQAGANPNLARPMGETPLMIAARTGSLDVVQALLDGGADVNAREASEDQTALMWAVSERHLPIATALIAHGADLHARTRGGFTPLMFAAREGGLSEARALLADGADANETARDGTSALLVATVRGHVDVATLLLDHGADPNAQDAGYAPLHWAAGSWETELTGPRGILPERETEWRALRGVPAGKVALVRALLAHGADPDARMSKAPPRVGYSQLAVEQRLAGVNLYVGATPLVLAAWAGDVDVMRVLAEGGADAGLTTSDHTTPLMIAAGLGRYQAESRVTERAALEVVNLALAMGNDVNARNDAGNTALHGAAYIKSNAIVQLLVERGADVNAKNRRGQTPLTVADTVRGGSATVATRTPTGDLLRKLGAASEDSATKP
jgi:ankyrin repeat protein